MVDALQNNKEIFIKRMGILWSEVSLMIRTFRPGSKGFLSIATRNSNRILYVILDYLECRLLRILL